MPSERGFSLLEVMFATTILAVAVAALAHLCALSTTANRTAKTTTIATILAVQKMEQLRSLTLGLDPLGSPLTDPRLGSSPSESLRQNTAGFCDFMNASGQLLGEGTVPPPGATYLRRWSIDRFPEDPDNVVVLQVVVTARFHGNVASSANRQPRDEARLVTVRARKAR